MYIVSERKIGVPKASREAFQLLQEAELLETDLAKSLMNIIGFRKIAIHDYQRLELDILKTIIEQHLEDFKRFAKVVIELEKD